MPTLACLLPACLPAVVVSCLGMHWVNDVPVSNPSQLCRCKHLVSCCGVFVWQLVDIPHLACTSLPLLRAAPAHAASLFTMLPEVGRATEQCRRGCKRRKQSNGPLWPSARPNSPASSSTAAGLRRVPHACVHPTFFHRFQLVHSMHSLSYP